MSELRNAANHNAWSYCTHKEINALKRKTKKPVSAISAIFLAAPLALFVTLVILAMTNISWVWFIPAYGGLSA
ncbi:MAG: hypothetical protein AAF636_21815, partial [Pseudomonadota bacterium]